MASQDLLGFKIGVYEIVERLGEGTSACSYLARDPKGKQAVARRLNDDLTAQPAVNAKFLAISELSSRIKMRKHVAIVSSQKVSPEGTFLLRDFVAGAPLSDFARNGNMDQLDADQIARNLCDAVRSLAACDIAHGGIHLGNVIVQPNGDAKLTDFAVSRACLTGQPTKSYPLEPLRYLSPEQWRGEAATTRSDIYSVGLITYWLDRMSHAFDAGDVRSLTLQLHNGFQGTCPVIAAAVASVPAKRYPKIDDLRSRLNDRAERRQKQIIEDVKPLSDEQARKDAEQRQKELEKEQRQKEAEQRKREEESQRAEEEARRRQEEESRKKSEYEAREGATAQIAVKTVAFKLSAVDTSGTNVLERLPPKPWQIPTDTRHQQRPLQLSHDADTVLDLSLSCVGNGVTVSPTHLNIPPGRASWLKVNLAPDSSRFANLVLQWKEGGKEKSIVLKIVR